jgi:hypothetical protein
MSKSTGRLAMRGASVGPDTIISAAFETDGQLRSMLAQSSDVGPRLDVSVDPEVSLRLFKIRAADTEGHRSSANVLIQRRYSWRGYEVPLLLDDDNLDRITLVASDEDTTIGTLSVGFDGAGGLLVEELFPREVRSLRDSGRTICEFTKLAMDAVLGSKRVLASLFHVAYIYAYRVKGFDCLLVEVNPRHVRYYEKILGFKVMGPERIDRRVNAPAVLLALDFVHTEQQIGKFGGRPQSSVTERSLYPYSFSVEEEAGIVGRLKGSADTAGQNGYRH